MPINGGGFALVYNDSNDYIVIEKYDNTFNKVCFKNIETVDGKHARMVYDDV